MAHYPLILTAQSDITKSYLTTLQYDLMNEKVLITNEHNIPAGYSTKSKIWQEGLWHRIVRVIIRTEDGLFLSQQRGLNMELYPGYWTDSASGHVDAGESDMEAAVRELKEEVGLDTELRYAGTFAYQDMYEDCTVNNFNIVFEGIVHGKEDVRISEEVHSAKWFDIATVEDRIASDGLQVTPTLKRVLTYVR